METKCILLVIILKYFLQSVIRFLANSDLCENTKQKNEHKATKNHKHTTQITRIKRHFSLNASVRYFEAKTTVVFRMN